jgi:uncharacterized repeat protein (TIGR01451 family)
VLPTLALTAVLGGVVPWALALPAYAAGTLPVNFFTTVDTDGANDVPGQSDLTQFGRDDSDANVLKLAWDWDATDEWTGNGQTGNACALFDSDGDGNINYAVCVEVHNSNATTVVQSASGSPNVLSCGDDKTDRCTNPSLVAFGAHVRAGVLGPPAGSSTGNLVMANDPFAGGSNYPNDTSVEVDIDTAANGGVLPASASLVNVCSYPSNGNNAANNKPFDCVSNLGASPSIALDKTTTSTSVPAIGQSISYTLTATNDGNVDLTNVHIDDSMLGTLSCTPVANSTLKPLETMVCTGSHPVTQADYDSGHVFNFATATGSPPTGNDVTANASKDLTATQSPDLSLTKSASPTTFTAAGETITYTVTATNTGNVTLFISSITDPMLGGNMSSCVDKLGAAKVPPDDLAPGDKIVCTGTYQTTANDVGAGKILNTATVNGFGRDEDRITRTANATVNLFVPTPTPTPTGSPDLGVTKTSVPPTGSVVHRGDQVVYTLSYGNTGTAAAAGATLTDALPAGLDYVAGSASNNGAYDAATRTLTWQLGSVATGAKGTVSFTGQVAATAVDGQVLSNVGVISAAGVNDPSNNDNVTVSVPSGDITITKAVDKDVAEFDDTLTYSIEVGATGNKDQTHVVATDNVPNLSTYVDGSAACDEPCTASESDGVVTWNIGTLPAGTSTVLTFQVTVNRPTPDETGGIPPETIVNVAQVTFDEDPVEISNEVRTDIVGVLGEKAVRPPKTKPEQHDRLPFTGLPLLQLVALSAAAAVVGMSMQAAGRRRPAFDEGPLPQWREG